MLLFTIRLNAQNTTIKKTFHLLLQYDFFPLNALQMRPLSFLYQFHWPSHLLQQFLTVIKVPGCSSIMWNSRSPRGHHPPWRESTNSFLDLELLNPKDILWERKKKTWQESKESSPSQLALSVSSPIDESHVPKPKSVSVFSLDTMTCTLNTLAHIINVYPSSASFWNLGNSFLGEWLALATEKLDFNTSVSIRFNKFKTNQWQHNSIQFSPSSTINEFKRTQETRIILVKEKGKV